MFTGLVQGRGVIRTRQDRGSETRLTIEPRFAMPDIVLGESIAVNGVCLTVEKLEHGGFSAYASAETMGLTNLGELAPGTEANLERALAMGDRLGGHLVSGHVDCVAVVASITPAGESKRIRLTFPEEFGGQVVGKGSVALDGVSLTINLCGKDFLEVNVIPSSQAETTIGEWKPGKRVNMETDMIAKYVQRMLNPYSQGEGQQSTGGLTEDFLRGHGF